MFYLYLFSRLSEYMWSADVYLLRCGNLIVNPQKQINKYPGDWKSILLVRWAAKRSMALFS